MKSDFRQSDRKAFDLALYLCQQAMEGLTISNFTPARKINTASLLEFLEQQVRELKPDR